MWDDSKKKKKNAKLIWQIKIKIDISPIFSISLIYFWVTIYLSFLIYILFLTYKLKYSQI